MCESILTIKIYLDLERLTLFSNGDTAFKCCLNVWGSTKTGLKRILIITIYYWWNIHRYIYKKLYKNIYEKTYLFAFFMAIIWQMFINTAEDKEN